MSIIGSNILAGASGNQGGYNINNSLRFRSSASAYLLRTFSASGTTATFSVWVKRGALGSYQTIFGWSNLSDTSFGIDLNLDTLAFYSYSYAFVLNLVTTQVLRDPSAWYHIVCVIDTTQATAANRAKIYINGSQVTALSTATYPTQNTVLNLATNTSWNIGRIAASTTHFDGYMAEINFIDGSALTPSSFGETSTTTGTWIPKAYSGSYGTNGFYLKFSDIATTTSSNAGLGKDFSGNGNYWTTNNISVTSGVTYDAMLDVPTNTSATVANYCTLNPLVNLGGNGTMSFGNLRVTTASSGSAFVFGTIGVSTGKWYWEGVLTTDASNVGILVGFSTIDNATYIGYYSGNGYKYTQSGSSAYGASWVIGDVIGVAADFDSNTITFYKNNTSQGAITSAFTTGLTYFPTLWDGSGFPITVADVNFGQRPFAYTAPTGFVALNTFNLPTPTILQGNKYMDATLYTQNGLSTNVITNDGQFKPDLVWIKCRSNAGTWNNLVDSVRGGSKTLYSNATDAEGTDNYINTFNSNGFTLNIGDTGTNSASGRTQVAWQWQAGQGSTSSNTSGTITSTVSVNTTAGFSIVTWSGNGTIGATVGHGLGVTPSMIIVKQRSGTESWATYHISLGATQYLNLNQTMAAATSITRWNNTTPSSTVITFYNDDVTNRNGGTYVAYCWAAISGFSAFGSYTGNGSADGAFVYTGFRPKYILIKRTNLTEDWYIYDTSRITYNLGNIFIYADLADAEGTGATGIDILSNGFKQRQTGGGNNASGSTYIYAAFAENPFKNANAR